MYQFNIFVYCILLGYSIYTRSLVFIASVIILGILILFFVSIYKKNKKEKIRNKIKNNPNEEVLNINKVAWWELEELPNFSRAKAKYAVLLREKYGRYTSKELFVQLNDIKNADEICKLISL